MTTNPTLITIKLLAMGSVPDNQQIEEALRSFGALLQVQTDKLVFDGTSLVAARVEPVVEAVPAPSAAPIKKGGRKPGSPPIKITKTRVMEAPAEEKSSTPGEVKPINFEAGSGPDRIWQLIRSGPALTSTQVRENLKLDSNIVNTTIYRLKKAGMVRPMSHTAINGDTLYTSTEWDPKPATAPIVASAIMAAPEEYTQDPDEQVDEDAF